MLGRKYPNIHHIFPRISARKCNPNCFKNYDVSAYHLIFRKRIPERLSLTWFAMSSLHSNTSSRLNLGTVDLTTSKTKLKKTIQLQEMRKHL